MKNIQRLLVLVILDCKFQHVGLDGSSAGDGGIAETHETLALDFDHR